MRTEPAEQAANAWLRLTATVHRIVLHFDVDLLDTGAIPLADHPHFNGLTLRQAHECLQVWTQRPELGAIVITEVNPTHDPRDKYLQALLDVVVNAPSPARRPTLMLSTQADSSAEHAYGYAGSTGASAPRNPDAGGESAGSPARLTS